MREAQQRARHLWLQGAEEIARAGARLVNEVDGAIEVAERTGEVRIDEDRFISFVQELLPEDRHLAQVAREQLSLGFVSLEDAHMPFHIRVLVIVGTSSRRERG
jgi:hypothetical protein